MKRYGQAISLFSCAAIPMLTLLLSVIPHRASGDPLTLTFNYTVLQGTCDVSVGGDSLGTNGVLDFGDVGTESVPASGTWAPLNPTAGVGYIYVTLKRCVGIGDGNTTPSLTLTGDMASSSNNNDKKFLFADASSTAKGLGFAIYRNDTSSLASDIIGNISQSPPDSQKYIDVGNKGDAAADQIKKLKAIVTCGGAACSAANRTAGALSANVTFTFKYR